MTLKLLKITLPLLLVFLIIFMLHCCGKKQYQHNSSHKKWAGMIINEQGKLSQGVLKLLQAFDIKHNGSLEDIVKLTQKKWLRSVGRELWEIHEHYEDKKKVIWPLLEEIGCVKEIAPTKKQYDYLLLHGALVSRVRCRLAYAVKLWEQGIRFRTIVFLSGQRPLDPVQESKKVLLDDRNGFLKFREDWLPPEVLPAVEVDMMKMVYEQSNVPQDMREYTTVVIVNALGEKLSSGEKARPTTDDTALAWLASNPLPGSCLAVSNQPYVGRQHAALRTLLPEAFDLETVGEGVLSQANSVDIFLDTIARWIYQEFEYYKKIKGI